MIKDPSVIGRNRTTPTAQHSANMSRSKSRSVSSSIERNQKSNHSSVFSRTISATKLCRGDSLGSQIAANALIASLDNTTLPKTSNLSQSQSNRAEKDRPLDESKRVKKEVNEANTRNEQVYPSKAVELMMELEYLKALLHKTRDELKVKDEKLICLELELVKARELDARKSLSLNELEEELQSIKEKVIIAENDRRVRELISEVESLKEAKSKIACELLNQSKELELNMKGLEESKTEITSLHDKIELLAQESIKKIVEDKESIAREGSMGEEIEHLEFEMCVMKEKLSKAEEEKRNASLETDRLLDEMELLYEAKKKKTYIVEDMVLKVKEAAREASQANEKMRMKETEVDHAKKNVEKLRNLLHEAKQETDLYKNTADRLKLEAEETFLAWNEKEVGFVSCVKRAEEERETAMNENVKLRESLNEAERMIRETRGETYKLREVLKQMVEESSSVRDQNAQLKARLAEKEEAVCFFVGKGHEASTMLKDEDKDEDHEKRNKNKDFNFNLEDPKLVNADEADEEVSGVDFEKEETLKSLIFNKIPTSRSQTPMSVSSSPFSASKDSGRRRNAGEYDWLASDDDDSNSDRSSHRKVSAMLRRVGDLLMVKRNFLSTD